MPFKYLEDIAIADVAFEATGKTMEEMFESAGLATMQVMAELKGVRRDVKKDILTMADSIEMLLKKFLDELIYIKDAELLLFSKFDAKITKVKGGYKIHVTALGEKLDMERHKLGVDVKATTMHMFEVKQEKGLWKARVILDI